MPFTYERASTLWGAPSVDVHGETINDMNAVIESPLRLLGYGIDAAWEARITTDLDIALRSQCSAFDWLTLVSQLTHNNSRLLRLQCLAFRYKQAREGRRRARVAGRDDDAINLGFIARRFKLAMRGQFYAGERPGHVDLSFFGMLAGFLYAGCAIGQSIIDSADLDEWASRMNDEIPLQTLFPGAETSVSP